MTWPTYAATRSTRRRPHSHGDTVAVTLHLQADRTGNADYTRFLQLYDPVLGMAAQADGVPVDGINPTWSWVDGEEIVDTVTLTIARRRSRRLHALHRLLRPRRRRTRPLFSTGRRAPPDNWLPLTQLTVR
ncbi:MAG: hypothetical protein R2851_18610 [Caldilineaceae bacterium]